MADGILKVGTITTSSGSGTITLGQSGETITVPSGATITNSGTATGFGGGITQADLWRYTGSTSTSNTRTVISADLERADDASFGYIGDGMTQSSGIFTFPETGIYYVAAQMNYYSSSTDSRYVNSLIQATTDNSSYDLVAMGRSYVNVTYGATYTNPISSCYVDVTNTSNVKVKFLTQSEASQSMNGNTDQNETFFTFIRLGDT